MTASPVRPMAKVMGTETMANAMTAVTVAMTGSQIIWRSCRKSSREARRIALPFGFAMG